MEFLKDCYSKIILAVLLLLAFVGYGIAGDTNRAGYNIQYFRPSSDGSGIFNVRGSSTLNRGKPHFGFYTNLSSRLLTATNTLTSQKVGMVDYFVTSDILLAIGVLNFMDVGLDMPIFFYENGHNFDTGSGFSTTSIGDARLDVKFRLANFGFLSSVYFPSGNQYKFTGSSDFTYEGRFILDKKWPVCYLSANAGFRLVPDRQIENIEHDDEILFGFGASARLTRGKNPWELLAEISGSTVAKNFEEVTSPIEALAGFRKKFASGISLSFAGGAGITGSVGSPDYRLLGGITFTRPDNENIKKDVDRDGAEISFSGETIYFDFDSYRMNESAEVIVGEVAERLVRNPAPDVVKIEGYADSTGDAVYNRELSYRRAVAVENYFIKMGVSKSLLSVTAHGEEVPAVANDNRDNRALNRRVVIGF